MLDTHHRLRRVVRQVDDLQPPVAEPDIAFDPQAAPVRAAVDQGVAHGGETPGFHLASAELDQSDYGAHQSAGPLRTIAMTWSCSSLVMPWNSGRETEQSLAARALGKSLSDRAYLSR